MTATPSQSAALRISSRRAIGLHQLSLSLKLRGLDLVIVGIR